MLTWPSPMASSSAAWVLGGVRLISSASSSWVKTGPGRNTISPVRWSYRGAPMTSEGSRSGVNWMRAKSRPSARANDRAISVLPRPGQVLQQHVAAGQDADQHQFERPAVADHRPLDLVQDGGAPLRGLAGACRGLARSQVAPVGR